MTPTRGRVLIRPEPKRERTEGGIWIPATSDEGRKPAETGVVVGLGAPRRSTQTGVVIPYEVSVGDRVFYGQYAAHVEVGNGLILLDGEQEIYAIVECGVPVSDEWYPTEAWDARA